MLRDTATGKEYILEMNGTSSGFCPDREDEDNILVRDLVLAKMEATLHATVRSSDDAMIFTS